MTHFLYFKGHLPFAIVGSLEEVKIGNKTVKARQYPWGIVQGKKEFEPTCLHLNTKTVNKKPDFCLSTYLLT